MEGDTLGRGSRCSDVVEALFVRGKRVGRVYSGRRKGDTDGDGDRAVISFLVHKHDGSGVA